MTTSAPILAQAFTESFTVYSAKRFPGVPGLLLSFVILVPSDPWVFLHDRRPFPTSPPLSRATFGAFFAPSALRLLDHFIETKWLKILTRLL